MEAWEAIELGKIAKVISGYAFKSSDFEAIGIPAIKIKNIKNGDVELADCDFVSDRFLKINSRYHVRKNDLLISLTGSHMTQPNSVVGRIALYRHNFVSLLNQRAGKVIPNAELVDPIFLYAYLSQESVKESIAKKAKGAANQANISPSDVEGTLIHLPPLPTQRRIASIFSAYDDLIENNLRRIKLLEELAQRTYEEWFVRFRFPGHETAVFDAETGLPGGWERKSLTDVADFINGFAFKPSDFEDTGIPIIKIKEMKNGISNDTPMNNGSRVPTKYLVQTGDILFSWSGSLEVVLWQHVEGWLNQHLFKVTPKVGVSRAFVYLSLLKTLDEFNNLTTGSTMKHIKRKELDFVKVAVATPELMDQFEEMATPVQNEILNLSKQVRMLKESRDILLPKLISGQLVLEGSSE